MIGGFANATISNKVRRRMSLAAACSLMGLACALHVRGADADPPAPGAASATLEQCLTAGTQAERAATFSGEMTAMPGSVRMAMLIEIEVRMPGEELFHVVDAPGLSDWRVSDAGVKTYRYLRQFTNLTAPAAYRAIVRFRWLNAKNHVMRVAERRTLACEQRAHVSVPSSPPTPDDSSSSTV
jgi:hypothetical protein